MSKPVTVHLPKRLDEQIEQRARKKATSIEEEIVAVLENAFFEAKDSRGVPADIAEEMAQLPSLDNELLWQAAQRSVPAEKSARMQELALKKQTKGLTDTEQEEVQQLLHFAYRVMMVRAKAAEMLKNRGKDISNPEPGTDKMGVTDLSNATPLEAEHGEIIRELIGREVAAASKRHSVAHVTIPPGKSSLLHYHPEAEESYIILKGKAWMFLENDEAFLSSGQSILIPPPKRHQIFNIGDTDLEFLAVCEPAWEMDNTSYPEG